MPLKSRSSAAAAAAAPVRLVSSVRLFYLNLRAAVPRSIVSSCPRSKITRAPRRYSHRSICLPPERAVFHCVSLARRSTKRPFNDSGVVRDEGEHFSARACILFGMIYFIRCRSGKVEERKKNH